MNNKTNLYKCVNDIQCIQGAIYMQLKQKRGGVIARRIEAFEMIHA